MAFLIDGKKISSQIKDELKNEVAEMKKEGTEVTLAVIQVGKGVVVIYPVVSVCQVCLKKVISVGCHTP